MSQLIWDKPCVRYVIEMFGGRVTNIVNGGVSNIHSDGIATTEDVNKKEQTG